jgi:hypothetical protein
MRVGGPVLTKECLDCFVGKQPVEEETSSAGDGPTIGIPFVQPKAIAIEEIAPKPQVPFSQPAVITVAGGPAVQPHPPAPDAPIATAGFPTWGWVVLVLIVLTAASGGRR